jgi:hypothetical protein
LATAISETQENMRELADRLRTLRWLSKELTKKAKEEDLAFALRKKEDV